MTTGALMSQLMVAGPLLTLALPVCLAYLVLPHAGRDGGRAAIVAAAVTIVIAQPLPPGLDLLCAMAAAAAAGTLFSLRESS